MLNFRFLFFLRGRTRGPPLHVYANILPVFVFICNTSFNRYIYAYYSRKGFRVLLHFYYFFNTFRKEIDCFLHDVPPNIGAHKRSNESA